MNDIYSVEYKFERMVYFFINRPLKINLFGNISDIYSQSFNDELQNDIVSNNLGEKDSCDEAFNCGFKTGLVYCLLHMIIDIILKQNNNSEEEVNYLNNVSKELRLTGERQKYNEAVNNIYEISKI